MYDLCFKNKRPIVWRFTEILLNYKHFVKVTSNKFLLEKFLRWNID